MAGAKNKVISGDYQGYSIGGNSNGLYFCKPFGEKIYINSSTVTEYNVVDSDKMKSGSSAIGRAAIGAWLLGPIGLFAAAGAKNKNVITVVIEFKNGKRSLIEIGQELYKILIKAVF